MVIGPGYWLEENDTTQAYKENSQVDELIFNPGSEGSLVQGLYMSGYFSSSGDWEFIQINTNNISLVKNYIYGYVHGNTIDTCKVISINGDLEQINIRQKLDRK